MKLRLIMRRGQSDYNGQFVGWVYSTAIVSLPDDILINKTDPPEIIGGEWIDESKELAGLITQARKMPDMANCVPDNSGEAKL